MARVFCILCSLSAALFIGCSEKGSDTRPSSEEPVLLRPPAVLLDGGGSAAGTELGEDPIHDTDVLVEFALEIPGPWFFEQEGLELLAELTEIEMVKVRSNADINAIELAEILRLIPLVESAEPDRGVESPEARGMSVSFNDGSRSYGDFVSQSFLEQMNVAAAHGVATGEGVEVAVIDTGVDDNHPDLPDHRDGYDFVDHDAEPRELANGIDDDQDGLVDEAFGHGTHVAGIISLLAPNADLLVYRVLDSEGRGMASDVAQAVLRALQDGADVINLSLGMYSSFRALEKAIDFAEGSGVTIVASLGNDGVASPPQYPAAYPWVRGIGSVNEQDIFSNFSNYGVHLHVCAPGEEILSLAPGGGYATWSGTSMATPMVAALSAVARSTSLVVTEPELAELLSETEAQVFGIPDGSAAGRIDFLAALQALVE